MSQSRKLPQGVNLSDVIGKVERPLIKDGKLVTKEAKGGETVVVMRAVEVSEVIDHGLNADATEITVVTVDGRKYKGELTPAPRKKVLEGWAAEDAPEAPATEG